MSVLSDAAHDTPKYLTQDQISRLIPWEAEEQLAQFLQLLKHQLGPRRPSEPTTTEEDLKAQEQVDVEDSTATARRRVKEPVVPEATAHTFNSHGVPEMSKKLAVKLTDKLREHVNEVQNHQVLIQSLTTFTQRAKTQSAAAVSKQNSLTEALSADTAAKDENIASA